MPEKENTAIRVFGLSRQEIEALRQIAHDRYGKASVSLLAKKLLQKELGYSPGLEIPRPGSLAAPKSTSKRITVRLPENTRLYLEYTAETHACSINDLVRDIVQKHIQKYPFHTKAELRLLYQYNVQLIRIGRNINQIARQLNSGETASITTQEIRRLYDYIDTHTRQIGKILLGNREG